MKKVDPVFGRLGPASAIWMVLLALVCWPAGPAYSGQAPATPSSAASQAAKPSAAPNDPAAVPPDKVVIKVGDQQVTAADVDFVLHTLSAQDQKDLETKGKETLGKQYIQMLQLEQQALRDHLDATTDFHREEAFEHARRLAQAEYTKMGNDVKVSPDEISQYYTAHPNDFDKVEMRQAGVRLKPASGGGEGMSLEEAKSRLEEVRKALTAPGADPEKVAKQFFVPNVVFVEPQARTVERGQLPAGLAEAIFKMKDGELSETKETPQSVFFVQKLKVVHPELKEVSSTIESVLHQQKLLAALGEMNKKTSVWTDEEFFKAPPAAKAASSAPAPSGPAANNSSDKPAQQPPR